MAGVLAGSGTISADGGDGAGDGGGGGGGRIAVYYWGSEFAGTLSVLGGAGYKPGGEGTVVSLARSTAPDAPDLRPISDSGHANDDLTNLDNSEVVRALQFDISGTVSGATVTVYVSGVAIGSAEAAGETTTLATNGTYDLTDGLHSITARQTEPGKAESSDSAELAITIDTVGPESAVALGEMTQSAEFPVTWSGQDDPGGSGVASYDVYVSTDGEDYVRWRERTTEAEAVFAGDVGHLYAFYSLARDNAGNLEESPAVADGARCVVGVTSVDVDTLVTDRAVVLGANTSLEILIAGGGGEFQPGTYTLIEAAGGLSGTFSDVTDFGAYASVNGNGLTYDETAGTVTLTLDKNLNPADANLDGHTDVSDRIIWNSHNFTFNTTFTTGDWNNDGATDVSDRIIWNSHNFTFATPAPGPWKAEAPPATAPLVAALAAGTEETPAAVAAIIATRQTGAPRETTAEAIGGENPVATPTDDSLPSLKLANGSSMAFTMALHEQLGPTVQPNVTAKASTTATAAQLGPDLDVDLADALDEPLELLSAEE